MHRNNKKLVMRGEVVRSLTGVDLGNVAGGGGVTLPTPTAGCTTVGGPTDVCPTLGCPKG